MALNVSDKNPFRSRLDPPETKPTQLDVTEVVAESSSSATAEASSSSVTPIPNDAQPRVSTPPAPPRGRQTSPVPSVLDIPDDAPPAYTPRANHYTGEATVEFGPRRPFQAPPPPLLVQTPQSTGYSAANVQPRPNGWSQYPEQHIHRPPPGPPPIPSSSRPTAPHSAVEPLSYPPGQQSYQSWLNVGNNNLNRRPSSASVLSSGSGPSNQNPSGGESTGNVADDGKPTTTPVAGHPLLRNGKILVYPAGHNCNKCFNTGYKDFDPRRPCSKCWDKFAKPYAGALVYAPFSASGSTSAPSSPTSTTQGATTLQRPLPHPPSRPNNANGYANGVYQPYSNPPPVLPPRPPMPSHIPSIPPVPPVPNMAPVTQMTHGPPPPGAVVYRPGDPRIGGRLCWRCHGSGRVTLFIFDEESCPICRGCGRVFG